MQTDMHSFRYQDTRIDVREQTGLDMMRARALLRRLLPADDEPEFDAWAQAYLLYVQVVTQVERVDGVLALELPPLTADVDMHRAAATALMALPGAFVAALENALNAVNLPPGDPDLAPPEALTTDQKKASK